VAGEREVRIRFTGESAVLKGTFGDVKRLFQAMQDDVDDSRLAGDQLAEAFNKTADEMRRRMAELSSTADVLADSLGPEMVAAIEASGRTVEDEVQRFERMGLTLDDIKISSQQLADAMKNMDDAARQSTGQMGDGFKKVAGDVDQTRSVVANFAGNAIQELPGVGAAFGPLNMAIGQFAEYASEGNIQLGNFVKAAGGLAAATIGIQLLTMAIESMTAKQKEMDARTDEVVQGLDEQVRKSYELATASAGAAGEVDGLRVAQEGLSAALLGAGDDGDKLQIALGQLNITGKEAADTLIALQRDPIAALTKLGIQSGLTADAAEKLARKVAETDEPFWGASEANLWLTDNLIATGKAMEELQDQAEKTSFESITEQYLNSAAAANDLSTKLVQLAESNLGVDRNTDPIAVWEEYNRLLGEADAQTRDAVLGTNEYAEALRAQEETLRAQEEAQRRASEAAAAAEQQARDLLSAQLSLIDSGFAVRDAQDQLTTSLVNLGTAIDDPTTKVDEYRQATDDAARAALAVADANVRQASDMAAASGATLSAAEQNRILVDSLKFMAAGLEPGSPLRVQLEGYIGQLERTDEASEISGSVKITGVGDAKDRLEELGGAADDVADETRTTSTAETQTAEQRLDDLKTAAEDVPDTVRISTPAPNVNPAVSELNRLATTIGNVQRAADQLARTMRDITGE
jgi:hypothetical protein